MEKMQEKLFIPHCCLYNASVLVVLFWLCVFLFCFGGGFFGCVLWGFLFVWFFSLNRLLISVMWFCVLPGFSLMPHFLTSSSISSVCYEIN